MQNYFYFYFQMSLILNIETSTEVCSVSISEKGKCKYLKIFGHNSETNDNKGNHSKLLAVFINEILTENSILPKQLDAVAISSGPGSYTGLRIGVSTCKGFCVGINLPLISVNTLQIMANMAVNIYKNDIDLYVPMIDAKRMEVYTTIFDKKLNFLSDVEAKIVDENSYSNVKNKKIGFFGNGMNKCKSIFSNDNFSFLPDIFPSAEYMDSLSEKLFLEKKFTDLVYFEPFYLKEFVATTPKNKF